MARGGTGKGRGEGKRVVSLRRARRRRSGICHRQGDKGGRDCGVRGGERGGLSLVLKVAMVRMRIH